MHGMPAETIARATKSFRVGCLAGLLGVYKQSRAVSERQPGPHNDIYVARRVNKESLLLSLLLLL